MFFAVVFIIGGVCIYWIMKTSDAIYADLDAIYVRAKDARSKEELLEVRKELIDKYGKAYMHAYHCMRAERVMAFINGKLAGLQEEIKRV